MFEEQIKKANVLLEALPYIKKFSGKTIVIKYGGSLMVNEALKSKFATDIVLLKYIGLNPVIVHGGGKEISRWMKKVGKEAEFVDGLRFTDGETMEITEMVLSGKISNEVVSLINQAGGKAVSLSGKDANLFIGKKVKSKTNRDLGFVGDIVDMDVSLINKLSDEGYIPVISSVGRNVEGDSLNMNADHVAEAIANDLKAIKLVYLTDVQGIMIDNEFVGQVPLKKAKEILDHPDIKGGMLPKLMCSIRALDGNVEKVHIINGAIEHAVILELFTKVGIGTMIFKA